MSLSFYEFGLKYMMPKLKGSDSNHALQQYNQITKAIK